MGYGGLRHTEKSCDIAYAHLALTENEDDPYSCSVAEDLEELCGGFDSEDGEDDGAFCGGCYRSGTDEETAEEAVEETAEEAAEETAEEAVEGTVEEAVEGTVEEAAQETAEAVEEPEEAEETAEESEEAEEAAEESEEETEE